MAFGTTGCQNNRTTDGPGEGTYTYNARDQLTSWTRGTDFDADGGSTSRVGWTVTYDRYPNGSLRQTIDRKNDTDNTVAQTKTYRYTGERLDEVRIDAGGTTKWDGYQDNEFGSTVVVQQGVSDEPVAHATTQNADCNNGLDTTDSNTTRYCYDEFDRLRRQRAPSSTTEQKFEYDGLDRRDKHTTVTSGSDGTPTGFSYLGTSPTLSGETVSAGAAGNDAVSIDRDSAGTPLAVTQQLGATATPSTHTFATDANGNPTGLESTTGGVDPGDRYVYDPYGDLQPTPSSSTTSADAANNPLRFNGFDYDSSVKTYDMQARNYRPDVGRFLQTDRYESSQSDLSLVANPLTQDRYDFVGGDPVDNVEFDGHAQRNGATTSPNDKYTTTKSGKTKAAPSDRQDIVDSRDNEDTASAQQSYSNGGTTTFNTTTGTYYPRQKASAAPAKRKNVFARVIGELNDETLNLHRNPDCDRLLASCNALQFGSGSAGDAAASLSWLVPGGPELRLFAEGGKAAEAGVRGVRAAGLRESQAKDRGYMDEPAPKLPGSRGGPGTGRRYIPADVKRQEIEASQGLCRLCKTPVQEGAGSPRSREFDHSIPFADGGDASFENVQSLCRTCNRQKGRMTTQDYIESLLSEEPGRRGPG